MVKVGHRKQYRKHTALPAPDHVFIEDVEKEDDYDINGGFNEKGPTVDWDNEDARWGNPPTINKPTIVKMRVKIDQLEDLDTVRGRVNIRIEVFCNWTDPRLAGRTHRDPLPCHLWSPRPVIDKMQGSFSVTTSMFSISFDSILGDVTSMTTYEGTIKNEMDLHSFPLDTDTIKITFRASQCYKRNGEMNVSWKTDYRLIFVGWKTTDNRRVESPDKAPFGWTLVSSSVENIDPTFCMDSIQFKLNLKRQVGFYIFKVVIPLVFITCLNFMGFFLGTLGERLSNNVSLFIAAMALLYVVGQDLPHTTFLTAIDRIVLVTLSLIFVTSIHFILLWRGERLEHLLEKLDRFKGMVEEVGDTGICEVKLGESCDSKITQIHAQMDKLHNAKYIVLMYFSVFMGYLLFEYVQLMIRRLIICRTFTKNVNKAKVFENGVAEHNKCVLEDPFYQIPAWILVDPFKILLVKQGSQGVLHLPPLQPDIPAKLLLSTGKAVVMSCKPVFIGGLGNQRMWMTIGLPFQAIEVFYDSADQRIKVCKDYGFPHILSFFLSVVFQS